jgi:hypothetical protein
MTLPALRPDISFNLGRHTRPTERLSSRPGALQARSHSLLNHRPFKLSKHTAHLEHRLARRMLIAPKSDLSVALNFDPPNGQRSPSGLGLGESNVQCNLLKNRIN